MANQLAGFGPLAAMGYVQQQGDIGRQRGQQERINMLAGQSYSATTPEQQSSLLSQLAQVDPQAAQDQQQQFQSQEDRSRKELYGMAQGWKKVPQQYRQGYYEKYLSPRLAAMGMGEQPAYDEATIDGAADQIIAAFGQQVMGAQPTDVRSFEMMTAGLSPEEKERARRVNLGLDPRQSSAAINYQKVRGPDGIERLVAVDPRRIGAQVVGDEIGYGSFSEAPQQSAPQGTGHFAAFSQLATEFPAVTMTSGARSAERNAQVGGQPNSQHLNGTAADYAVPANQKPAFISRARQLGYQAIDEGDHIHLQLPRSGGGGVNMFAGRRPEDEAAAVEAAKLNVQQQFLPQELGMRTDAAIRQEAGKAAVSAQADRNKTMATRERDANTALELLDQAERLLPSATGSLAGAVYDRGLGIIGRSTEGAQATAGLKAIAGQLTSKMPRMEGPQSDKDVQLYKEMAGDLANDTLPIATRQAALRQIRALQQKYAGGSSERSNTVSPRAQQDVDFSNLWN
ncbi:D-Ala-D-Ala carboxypeptidase family metallohydrolase [Stenotrophomonas sp.]|uniref:D-Ala-D-Ala carboxypeptidase family metallohydrolase n=1 Tax=Stenotrophomonas sp. TaxID=69392 RepID=UPI0028AB6186|nr:D-Ala-D-Ala carboxypeptidase family metallohydrolase [Stenotrophomonas sp.]